MKAKLFLIPLIFGLGVALFVVKKQEKIVEESPITYEQKTWDGFTEYKRLQMILQGFAIESIVDIPCLDFDKIRTNLGIKRYIGVTSSRDKARELQALFGSETRTFFSFSVDVDVLPKADLILCWDELCTLPTNRASSALFQFKKSGAKFLLMRHFPQVKKNHKNKTGGFVPVNWTLPPYNMPEPMIQIMEQNQEGMESLALWDLETVS